MPLDSTAMQGMSRLGRLGVQRFAENVQLFRSGLCWALYST